MPFEQLISGCRFPKLTIGFCLTTFVGSQVCGETLEAKLVGPENAFQESFDEFPQTSSTDIIGIVVGKVTGPFQMNEVILANPPASLAPEALLCLQAVTQDGRFLADNAYSRLALDEQSQLRIAPVTRAYQRQLAGYDTSRIAIRAVLAGNENCAEPSPLFLPQLGASDPGLLKVLVNSRNRDGEVIVTGTDEGRSRLCSLAGQGARLAYDLVCSIPVTAGMTGRISSFNVRLDDGFAIEEIPFKVYVPTGPEGDG